MDLSDRGERGDVRRVNVDLRSSDRYDGAETRAAAMAWKRYSFFLFRFLLILSNGETEGTTKKGEQEDEVSFYDTSADELFRRPADLRRHWNVCFH